ncbi:putative quinol monooxygenase [Mycobacterium intracellulare]|uniref:Antibiotic biosynthesis monooxygenase n=1 Tax=Mycobacterium intracellulare TaxID=1767 RepID=A0AAE4RKN2_MYCIT|nr:antibiotic biosynthesis monooxygenase [Mycobacterium intracellulare]MDV6980019.1 antibiotic biosynthesis monooxygenase [Mycobacterium intracellulare]MDV6985576.1 antibiotic biosynthesis monooxygenase [Mycobacterium intracellulare]MDV7015804.1 antibiotic biosynthesis monooxygenase [Mycobacterium intracellulare]MDV7030648.1 antibiotic biosynthesis monooxygenase [Mycobacterium intracellulare]
MIEVALSVIVQAKPGKEKDVADFLRGARSIVEQEQGTRAWFALQLDESTFGIFDVFPDDDARRTHLSGGVGQALAAQGEELFSAEPSIQNINVLAYKLPGESG